MAGLFEWAGRRLGFVNPNGEAAERLLDAITGQSREPEIFLGYAIPDTIDGRFDTLALAAHPVLRRLRDGGEEAKDLSQTLSDRLFKRLDFALREMGVGDMSVAKKMHKMADAFYGRLKAYDVGLELGDDSGLVEAMVRNVYRGDESHQADAERLAAYHRRQCQALSRQPLEALLAGQVTFEEPVAAGAGPTQAPPAGVSPEAPNA